MLESCRGSLDKFYGLFYRRYRACESVCVHGGVPSLVQIGVFCGVCVCRLHCIILLLASGWLLVTVMWH